jgi:hypothetical protein
LPLDDVALVFREFALLFQLRNQLGPARKLGIGGSGLRDSGESEAGRNEGYLFPKTGISARFKILSVQIAAPP